MSDRDRTAVNQRPERASYRPRLTVYGCPAYCTAHNWIVVYDGDDVPSVKYVERVDRAWKDQHGLYATRLPDGSRREFHPETADTNGRNPCLLWITGEPHPWYFDSGWDTLGVMSQDHGDSGD